MALAFILAVGHSMPAIAQEHSLRGGMTGLWYDPAQDGHGVQVEVINPREAVVGWYTFDPAGSPIWLLGVGRIEGPEIRVTLRSYSGGEFPPDFDPADISSEVWGEATLNFEDCWSGQMTWTPQQGGFSAGSMPLQRLTLIQDMACGAAEAFHRNVDFSFDAGPGQWSALFADYSEGDSIDSEAEWRQLPEPLADREGFMLAGTNTPDDLAMFLKAPIGGLMPDAEYQLELEMEFATSVPQDCAGIGGSPGSSVYVKLGAAGTEPEVIESEGDFRLNIDKGGQSQSGEDAVVVGDMANFQKNCTDDAEWQLKTVSTGATPFSARSDAEGRLWVYAGTDSAFEGRTMFFITRFTARLTRAESM